MRLESVDQEIYEREHMDYVAIEGSHSNTQSVKAANSTTERHMVGERLMDRYIRPSRNLEKPFIALDSSSAGANVIPSCIHTINFKSDWDQRTSATGSVSFGTLHNPTLTVEFDTTGLSGNYDVIVIAELNNLILYQTNGAGATSIRRFTE